MNQTLEIFSDSQALRDNALTRVDTRVKLILALAAVGCVLLSEKMLLPLAAFGGCAACAILLRVPAHHVALRIAGPVLLAAMLCLLRALFSTGTPLAELPLGPGKLVITRQGLSDGLLLGSRVLGAVSILLLLGSVTPAYKVFAALRWAHLPETLVELALMMYRYIFALLEQFVEIRDAQRVRLGYTDVRRSLSSAGNLAGMVILRSLDQAQRVHDAMAARGYQGTLPMASLGQLGLKEAIQLATGMVVLAGAFLLSQGGPL